VGAMTTIGSPPYPTSASFSLSHGRIAGPFSMVRTREICRGAVGRGSCYSSVLRLGHTIRGGAPTAVQAAVAKATKHDWPMNIAVTDLGGNLVGFLRMDGALLASIAVSEHKARPGVKFRRPTKVLEDAIQKSDYKICPVGRRRNCHPGAAFHSSKTARLSARSVFWWHWLTG
jgi:hypothetical protein